MENIQLNFVSNMQLTIMVHNFRTVLLSDLVLLVGNLGTLIDRQVHKFTIHPQIGSHFLIDATTRYNPTSINADVANVVSHDTRRNTNCKKPKGVTL
jgi:hypothetical protein